MILIDLMTGQLDLVVFEVIRVIWCTYLEITSNTKMVGHRIKWIAI